MSPRHPGALPEPLRSTAFTTSTAARHGVGPERFRGKDLAERIHGVRSTLDVDDELSVRCRMFAARLPEGVFFSHSTAARLLGIPLPPWLERLAFLHVTIEAPKRAPHATGIRGHSRLVLPGDVITMPDGLAVSSPARVLCEMASILMLADLVAVADHIIHHTRRLATLGELADRIQARDRISRSRLLPIALGHTDERAESRPESLVRMYCVLAGLPRPVANHEIVNPTTGRPVRFDLAWPDRKVAIEYHGDLHRERSQWRKDLTRKAKLEAAGWIIIEVNADDLRSPQEIVGRVLAAFARRG
jgi:hypothetical protein